MDLVSVLLVFRIFISGIVSFDFFNFELDFFFIIFELFLNSEFDISDSLILVFLVWDNSLVHPVGWRRPASPIEGGSNQGFPNIFELNCMWPTHCDEV